ncbi:nuclear transport factor 2 family protein [Rhodococcus sp. NPDC058505]|uniref:nuclear transport factor 2 family protein n=1 Tax=unclassified Rhodococcus (in: high G+C Gram-positive bacteria) TaxID=192944 RepID=UPI0036620579
MASAEELRAVVERYVHLIATGTGAEIAALYAEDGSVEDPVGSEPKVGRAALAEFYDRAAAMENTTELLRVRVAGNEAAAHFRVASKAGDTTYTTEPIDTFRFNDAGEIVALRAYWAPSDMIVS